MAIYLFYSIPTAHVPLAYLPNATDVLIVGGGDGGTLLQVGPEVVSKRVNVCTPLTP